MLVAPLEVHERLYAYVSEESSICYRMRQIGRRGGDSGNEIAKRGIGKGEFKTEYLRINWQLPRSGEQ